jgi:hypothetical protein
MGIDNPWNGVMRFTIYNALQNVIKMSNDIMERMKTSYLHNSLFKTLQQFSEVAYAYIYLAPFYN